MKVDNIATSYFFTQKKLTPKQARWQIFLAEFDFMMEYKPSKTNCVVDTLSSRTELASISSWLFLWQAASKKACNMIPKPRTSLRLQVEARLANFG